MEVPLILFNTCVGKSIIPKRSVKENNLSNKNIKMKYIPFF